MADKESLNQDSRVPYTDLKPRINRFLSNKWQERWSSCSYNKLFLNQAHPWCVSICFYEIS